MHDYSQFKTDAPDSNWKLPLQTLARELLTAREAVARAEEALAAAKAVEFDLERHKIPNFMQEIGQTEAKLSDGTVISVKETLHASIKEGNEAAFEWLTHNGGDSIIKRKITIEFDRGDLAWANQFISQMKRRKRPLPATISNAVHHKTLSSFLKHEIERGTDVPMQLLGAALIKSADVKVKKD